MPVGARRQKKNDTHHQHLIHITSLPRISNPPHLEIEVGEKGRSVSHPTTHRKLLTKSAILDGHACLSVFGCFGCRGRGAGGCVCSCARNSAYNLPQPGFERPVRTFGNLNPRSERSVLTGDTIRTTRRNPPDPATAILTDRSTLWGRGGTESVAPPSPFLEGPNWCERKCHRMFRQLGRSKYVPCSC